jgi:PEP-CTERM motif
MLRRNRSMLVLLSFLAVIVQGSVRGGTVTYQIQNYPANQDGWTLSGTITIKTSATSGTLAEGDITAWSWTISKGSDSYTYKSTDKGAAVQLEGTVTYTPTQILMPVGTKKDPNLLILATDSGYPALFWENKEKSPGYYGRYVPPGFRFMYAWNEEPKTLGGKRTWVLASVPEPSGVLLAGLGFACVIPYAMFRRRRTGLRAGRSADSE